MAVGVYDQTKKALQDIIAPELHQIRADIQGLNQKIDGVDARLTIKIESLRTETVSMKGEVIAEIRRVDNRIDAMEREVRTAIDIRERLAALEARRPA